MMLNGFIKQAQNGRTVLTKFLNPSETSDLESLRSSEIKISFWGGYHAAERRRALIFDKDYDIDESFEIVTYKIIYPKDFLNIQHRNILGTILSLGIKRETLGDIIVTGEEAYFICTKEIAPYLLQNFISINHQSIELKEVESTDLESIVAKSAKEISIVIASMRLDLVVAKLMNCSRSISYQHIMTKNVFINHRVCDNHHQNVQIGDTISIRKWGRAKILSVQETKKLRLRVKFKVWR